MPRMQRGKEKKHVFKYGDRVIIKNPEVYIRVGYPLTPDIIKEEILKDEGKVKIINEFLEKFDLKGYGTQGNLTLDDNSQVFEDILYKLSYFIVRAKGFGGRERKIFTEYKEEYKNKEATVIGKKYVRTGEYQGGGGGYSYDGDYEQAPAYLENVKTHVILSVSIRDEHHWVTNFLMEDFKIEAANVELIKEAEIKNGVFN